MRRAVARVDLGAIERNVSRLVGALESGTSMCAVVKANGYGHGMAESARAALKGGASMLAVATAGEAAALRREIGEAPIFVMGAIAGDELGWALGADAEVSVWRDASRELLGAAAAELGVIP